MVDTLSHVAAYLSLQYVLPKSHPFLPSDVSLVLPLPHTELSMPPEQATITHIDRRTCRCDRPMEVLALGLSRTGTDCRSVPPMISPLTFQAMFVALKIPGYDAYHGCEPAFRNPPDINMWDEAAKVKYCTMAFASHSQERIGTNFSDAAW
ncbi:hypothetical protein BDZ45DRAFT_80868 [Acephala macrosclerotiorum]|nr:hypothetical protein BDZ45DRAFT_80868 [Acephala macrosclerotiorum]